MNAFMFYKKYRIPKNKIKFFKKFTTFYVNLRQFTPFFFTTKTKTKSYFLRTLHEFPIVHRGRSHSTMNFKRII